MNGFVVDASNAVARVALAELRRTAEHVAMFIAKPTGSSQVRLTTRVELAPEHLERQRFHVALTDVGRGQVLRTATSHEGWLVEMHSHGRFGDPAEFSIVDREGLRDWVPHLHWRLPGRGYVAIVTGDATIDGLVWHPGETEPTPLASIVLGDGRASATQLSYANWRRK